MRKTSNIDKAEETFNARANDNILLNQEQFYQSLLFIKTMPPECFYLSSLLELFAANPNVQHNTSRAYEIVAYSVFDTVITEITNNSIRRNYNSMLKEFADLICILLGTDAIFFPCKESIQLLGKELTKILAYGLNKWANFGPAVQIKHLTLNENLTHEIVDQVESDHIVIVCRDAEASVIQAVLNQIGWGRRVRGIVKETDLIDWYERCLRGKFKNRLAKPLLERLSAGFKAEFPQTTTITEFLEERGYLELSPPKLWLTETEESLSS